jgi:electron transfer flavoprotein alpha subunit
MTALVIAEHDNASIKGATLNTVSAAVALGGDVHVLVAGHNAGAAAEAAAKIAGVAKVLVADSAALAEGLAENVAAQVIAVASGYSCSRPRPQARTSRHEWPRCWMSHS